MTRRSHQRYIRFFHLKPFEKYGLPTKLPYKSNITDLRDTNLKTNESEFIFVSVTWNEGNPIKRVAIKEKLSNDIKYAFMMTYLEFPIQINSFELVYAGVC